MAGPTGIEPATLGLRVRCSSLTELRTRTIPLLKKGSIEQYRACGFIVAALCSEDCYTEMLEIQLFFLSRLSN
jgi:hypothetical protein